MKQKLLSLFLVSCVTLLLVNAQSSIFVGERPKRINLINVGLVAQPGHIRPFSLDEPVEVSLDAYLTEEAILIYSSSDLASVQIELSSDNGVVYSSETNMVANEPISINLSGFSSDIYTLYIKVGESEYIGFVYL